PRASAIPSCVVSLGHSNASENRRYHESWTRMRSPTVTCDNRGPPRWDGWAGIKKSPRPLGTLPSCREGNHPIIRGSRMTFEYWVSMVEEGKPVTLAGCSLMKLDRGWKCSE